MIIEIGLLILRAILAAVLIAAGAAKLADTRNFGDTLYGLGMPVSMGWLVNGLVIAFPLVELGLGFGLVSGVMSQEINLAVLVLMVVFMLITLVALIRKPNLKCRCFGALSDSQFSGKGLIRIVFLVAAAAVVVLGGPSTILLVDEGSILMVGLLMVCYGFFAIGSVQAAKTIAAVKERS